MPTDNDRREVARRLRGLRGGWSSGECYYTIIHELDMPDTSREDGGHALYGALADLIEPQPITGDTSDGYHTFDELYDHRAKLFSVIVRCFEDRAWKSKLHHDGTMYEGMFIVGIETPDGQATYHYDVDPYWDLFDCEVLDRAPEWDGHTPRQAIDRIAALGPSCDRDALLELADEMENNTWYETGFDHHIAVRFARRIREALGGEGCDHADEREIIAWVRDHGGLADVKRYWTLGVEASTACGVEVTDDASLTSCLHVLGCLTEYDVPLARAAVAELWPGGRPDECDNDRVIDELRRRLMPEGMEWPRDAKGVPIVRGETVFANGGGKGDGRAWYVRRVCPGFAYPVDAEDGKGERRDLKAHWVTHERPAPKVLDADGVEIRKGDTVYGVENGTEYEVCEAKLPRVTVEYWCAGISVHSGIAPSLLTHRAPVLAADGRPLREGGMVWDGKGNGPYIIKKIEDDGIVRIDSNDLDYFASEFFSERPDSWERLEEDCAKSDVDYCAERGLLDPSCDTVEGDASTRHCTDCCCTCDEKMARDLVRRSKKLAERGESGDAVPAWYAAGRLEAVARSIREILGVES